MADPQAPSRARYRARLRPPACGVALAGGHTGDAALSVLNLQTLE
jgi:hypothetical protein